MTRSIYLWTSWNFSVISCSDIKCRSIFPSLPLPINFFFFFTFFCSGTHAIRIYILSLCFTIYFETFYFIRHTSADSIPKSNKHSSPDHLSEPNGFHFRSEMYKIGSRSSIDKHFHTSGIGRVVTSWKIILSSFLFISANSFDRETHVSTTCLPLM